MNSQRTPQKRQFKGEGSPWERRGRKPKGSPSKKLLGHMLDFYGVPLQPEPLNKLWDFHNMLRAANTDSDLTRLHSFSSMVERHYVDCLIVPGKLTRPLSGPLLDIGTGGGFPGIPLKIAHPGLKIILAEPRPRRVEFLKSVIQKLNLEGITVFDHRVTHDSFSTPIAGTISRAFASLQKTLELTGPLLTSGGKCILMKGPAARQELSELELPPGFKNIQTTYYSLPHSSQKRCILVYKKV